MPLVSHMDTYTETIKFDRRLEVALVSWDAIPLSPSAPSTVSELEKQEWESCLGLTQEPRRSKTLIVAPYIPQAWMQCDCKESLWERRKTGYENQPSNEQKASGNSLALPGND